MLSTEIQNQLPPVSCSTSAVFGAQQLRSGEEAFCDKGWTVSNLLYYLKKYQP